MGRNVNSEKKLVGIDGNNITSEKTIEEIQEGYREDVKKAIAEQRGDKTLIEKNKYALGGLNMEVHNRVFKSYKELNPHSFVEEEELEANKKLVRELLGFEPPRTVGFNMCVMLYIRPEKVTEGGIYHASGISVSDFINEGRLSRDQYTTCVALVCYQGNECYTNPLFQGVRWCNVGDWILFPRNEGVRVNYRGVQMQFIQDINMYSVIEDPAYVTRD